MVVVALGFYLVHGGFTPEKYASVLKKLEAAGAGSPKGRTLHVLLAEAGVTLNEPMVATVHNVIKG